MSATPSTKLRTGLAEVFQTFGAEYLDAHGLTAPQAKVFRAVLDCRTAALGGHCLECDTCGHRKYVYHSCRNRHCPNCQTRAKEEWSRRRMTELLPVPYAHLVFTLPHDLNPLAAVHDRWLYDMLMASVAATLSEFARNPRWLGAEPAFTLVLHTFRQAQDRPEPRICAAIFMSMCSSPAAALTHKVTGSNRNATRVFCFRFMPCHGSSGPSSWTPWMLLVKPAS